MLNYLNHFDIISLCETWTKSDNELFDLLPDHVCYALHGKRRSNFGRTPGGIAVYIRNTLSTYVKHLITNEFAIYFRIDKLHFGLNNDILLVFVYVPHEGSSFYHERDETNGLVEFEKSLADIYASHRDCELLIAGDFNSRTGNLPDYLVNDDITFVPNMEW